MRWEYIAVGLGLAGLAWVAVYRRPWLKWAMALFGLLGAAAIARSLLDRQRRFRELGLGTEEARRVALLTVKAEDIARAAVKVGAEAERDGELRAIQDELEAELAAAGKAGADAEAIRAAIRRSFPGF